MNRIKLLIATSLLSSIFLISTSYAQSSPTNGANGANGANGWFGGKGGEGGKGGPDVKQHKTDH